LGKKKKKKKKTKMAIEVVEGFVERQLQGKQVVMSSSLSSELDEIWKNKLQKGNPTVNFSSLQFSRCVTHIDLTQVFSLPAPGSNFFKFI
jgi:ribosomal protein L31E